MTTVIWFLLSMSSNVLLKNTFTDESFLTMTALMCFLPCVKHHILVQRTLPCKAFLTLAALTSLFPHYECSCADQKYS